MAYSDSIDDMPGASVVINGVTCKIVTSSFDEHADQGGQGARRGYLCDWDKRFLVANSLLGLTTVVGTGPNASVTRGLPGQLAELPGMWALGVRIEGKGAPFQNAYGIAYTYAIVWTEYGNLPYTPGSNGDLGETQIDPNTSFVYATQELDSSEEYVTAPAQFLKRLDNNVKSKYPKPYVIHMVDMTITFHKMPYIPMPALAYVGSVNDGPFLGCAKGKVKFCGIKVSRDFSSVDDTVLQKAAYRFCYRPVADWNSQLDAGSLGDGSYTVLYYGLSSAPKFVHPYIDMTTIWPGGYVTNR